MIETATPHIPAWEDYVFAGHPIAGRTCTTELQLGPRLKQKIPDSIPDFRGTLNVEL